MLWVALEASGRLRYERWACCADRGDAPSSSAAGCWLIEGQRLAKEDDVRVTTALNRLLRLPGASVIDVSFSPQGVIVTVRLRRRRRVCSACGQTGAHLQIHGRRVKRWRHL
ncbi:MAG: hypothetical protein M3401_01600, partial [Actinomycetota bacterium]|nr:hypothetical protein [Actinomycetota bacterium]